MTTIVDQTSLLCRQKRREREPLRVALSRLRSPQLRRQIGRPSDPPASISHSNANPHHAHHNIHPLALATLVLEAPHAVALIVPVRAARAVHAAAAHALLHFALRIL
jgi:hypothetical protein